MPRFAANISMLFADLPFLDRVDAAAKAGFPGIECMFPYHVEAEALSDRLLAFGKPLVLMNAPPGDYANGERGLAALPGREMEFRDSFQVALQYAGAVDCAQIHVMAGKVAEDDIPAALDALTGNLAYAADEADAAGVRVLVEPILMDDYLIQRPDQALEIIQQVDRKNLRLQYDLYHAQMTQGGLTAFLENNLDVIAHIQVAGVPDRHEPDQLGEVNWRYIFDLLDSHGYPGWVGAEYVPRGDTLTGLGWAKDWAIGKR